MHQVKTDVVNPPPPLTSLLNRLQTLEGTATVFVEPEQKRLTWMVRVSDKNEPVHIKIVRQGDFLVVTDQSGQIRFQGDIVPVYSLTEPIHTFLPVQGHEVPARGFQVSWHQKGWEPNEWASLFTQGTLSARLVRTLHDAE
jgi:hypothetical protein